MTSLVHLFDTAMATSRYIDVPDYNSGFIAETTAIERLPTEPVGQTTLTLTGIAVGSRYRIERQADGSLATPTANAEGVAGSTSVSITVDYYGLGSENNNLRIKVRKGTASTKYQPFETQVTVSASPASAFIAQVVDTIA